MSRSSPLLNLELQSNPEMLCVVRHALGQLAETLGFSSAECRAVVLEDRGKKIDHAKLCGRPLEEVRPGGLGLHFISECMDAVEFRRKFGKNHLRLIKLLDVPKPEKGV